MPLFYFRTFLRLILVIDFLGFVDRQPKTVDSSITADLPAAASAEN